MRTPVREAFSYGIWHICDSMKYELMLHWVTMKCAVSRMKMPRVRESASSLISTDRSNQLLPTSVASSTLHLFALSSNIAVPPSIHWIPPWPNGLRPLRASHVVWSFNHGIFLMKISYRIPFSHPSTSAVMLLPCATFVDPFQSKLFP